MTEQSENIIQSMTPRERSNLNLKPNRQGEPANPGAGRKKGSPNLASKLLKMLNTEVGDLGIVRDEEMKVMIEMLRKANSAAPVKDLKLKDILNARIIIESINGNEKFVKILLDRVYGRAPLSITADIITHGEIDTMTDTELETRLEQARQRRLAALIDKEIHEAIVIQSHDQG